MVAQIPRCAPSANFNCFGLAGEGRLGYDKRRMYCRRIQSLAFVATFARGLLASLRVAADTLTLQPVADTTLIAIAPDNNLGGAGYFNAGTAGNGYVNRALLRFDLTIIPSGSQILGVSLTMDVVREPETPRIW